VSDLLQSVAGTDDYFEFGGVTRGPGGNPIDLTLPGSRIWFTARACLDCTPLVTKTSGVTGGPGGITVDDPTSTAKNMLTVTVAAADTEMITKTVDLIFDVFLEEPSGRRSSLFRGEWQVRAAITTPA
jgi:hypothetical protein